MVTVIIKPDVDDATIAQLTDRPRPSNLYT